MGLLSSLIYRFIWNYRIVMISSSYILPVLVIPYPVVDIWILPWLDLFRICFQHEFIWAVNLLVWAKITQVCLNGSFQMNGLVPLVACGIGFHDLSFSRVLHLIQRTRHIIHGVNETSILLSNCKLLLHLNNLSFSIMAYSRWRRRLQSIDLFFAHLLDKGTHLYVMWTFLDILNPILDLTVYLFFISILL